MTADSSLFSDAYDALDEALVEHYRTGDYVCLGMALQDHQAAVFASLRASDAQAKAMATAGFHRGQIIHGDAE